MVWVLATSVFYHILGFGVVVIYLGLLLCTILLCATCLTHAVAETWKHVMKQEIAANGGDKLRTANDAMVHV